MDAMKTCTKCGETKPATVEYFNRRGDGFQSYCRACTREYGRSYREANKERLIERRRAYYAANKEYCAEHHRKWREANKDHLAAYNRSWSQTKREHLAERSRVARATNPARFRAAEQTRRARLLAAPGTHTAADVRAQRKAQKGKCYYCGVKVGKDYHVEHVIPLSRGGSNGPENIVIACATCNHKKGDKLPSEWAEGGRLI